MFRHQWRRGSRAIPRGMGWAFIAPDLHKIASTNHYTIVMDALGANAVAGFIEALL
ncbi:hypothetical protein ACX80D_01185 [Arthrobacter sp. Sr24]